MKTKAQTLFECGGAVQIRVLVRTATPKNEPPEKIVTTYEDWSVWTNATQQVTHACRHRFFVISCR
jgi:hypothetical protein